MLVGKINDYVKSEEIVFPCLMKANAGNNAGNVVLFSSDHCGVVVVAGGNREVGYYSDKWDSV